MIKLCLKGTIVYYSILHRAFLRLGWTSWAETTQNEISMLQGALEEE